MVSMKILTAAHMMTCKIVLTDRTSVGKFQLFMICL